MLRMALLRRSRSRSVPEVSPEAGTWLGMRHLAGNAVHGLKVAVTAASACNDFLVTHAITGCGSRGTCNAPG